MHHTHIAGGGYLKGDTEIKRRGRRKVKEFEEVEYEPRSVRELLTEMKDISDLIVDLAYSALVFDSKEIAEEVNELELEMDKLNYQIRLTALIATRSMDDAESLTGILQIASAAEHISNAAGDIVELITEGIDTRPFLPFVLRDADEKFNIVRVSPDSELTGKTMSDARIETSTGATVIAVKRKSGWIFDPPPDHRIRGNDILIIRSTQDGYERLLMIARGSMADQIGFGEVTTR